MIALGKGNSQAQGNLYLRETGAVMNRLILLMFLSAFGRGITAPWINLYLSESGITETTIGIILAIGALMELSITPLLNSAADRRQRHRLLHIAQLGLYALCCVLLAVVTNVWVVGLMVILIELGKRPAIVLGLQLALTKVQEYGQENVGPLRASTAGGFGVANFLIAPIFALGGFAAMFFIGALTTLSSIGLASSLPKHTNRGEQTENKSSTKKPRNRGLYYLMAAQFFALLGLRAGFDFWLIHFRDSLGFQVEDMGILLGIMAILEVPFFLLFNRFAQRFDVRKLYIVGLLGMGVMWLLIGLATSAVWLVPVLVLRGLVFALFHLSILILVSRISHPENVATNQALLQITVPGVAALIGMPIMGWTYEHLGGLPFFIACAVLMVIGAGIAAASYSQLRRPEPDSELEAVAVPASV